MPTSTTEYEPATDELIEQLRRTVAEYATIPRGDEYEALSFSERQRVTFQGLNLSGFMGERMGVVLARLDRAEGLYVEEGWWHPNVKDGRVHDHSSKQPHTMHRLCEPVYTRRG